MRAPVSGQNLRQAQSQLARTRIATAARERFLEDGYVVTSMAEISRAAGVSVQTIYNVVGNKAAVLSAVLDLTAAGPDAPRPVRVFMKERGDAVTSFGDMIGVLASWFAEVHPRSADVFHLIRQAASVDAEVAELERARADQRLANYALAAVQVRERGGLTSGLDDEEAAAAIWSIGHPDTYRSLVRDRGWTLDRYRAWLETVLGAALR